MFNQWPVFDSPGSCFLNTLFSFPFETYLTEDVLHLLLTYLFWCSTFYSACTRSEFHSFSRLFFYKFYAVVILLITYSYCHCFHNAARRLRDVKQRWAILGALSSHHYYHHCCQCQPLQQATRCAADGHSIRLSDSTWRLPDFSHYAIASDIKY